MCADLARGEIHGSTAAMQNHCSQHVGDGAGAEHRSRNVTRASGAQSNILGWSWTGSICTVLFFQLILDIFKERGALRVERNGGWESIVSTSRAVDEPCDGKHWAQRSFQKEKLINSGSGESGKRDAQQACCRRAPLETSVEGGPRS